MMKRKMTYRERIGYDGEKLATIILEAEGYFNIKWLHTERLGGKPFDIIAQKNGKKYYIDVKSSISNGRKLPVHDHSLVRLILYAEKDHAVPLILIVKPSKHTFIDPYKLLYGEKDKDAYVYYCYLSGEKGRDLKKILNDLRRKNSAKN